MHVYGFSFGDNFYIFFSNSVFLSIIFAYIFVFFPVTHISDININIHAFCILCMYFCILCYLFLFCVCVDFILIWSIS